jgi:hypothetical protein
MERDYSKNRRLILGTILISAKIKNQLAVENTGIMSMAKSNALGSRGQDRTGTAIKAGLAAVMKAGAICELVRIGRPGPSS